MKIYQFQQRQRVTASLEEAWQFFANPANLLKLMPDWMVMKPIGKPHDPPVTEVYAGYIEVYEVTPRFIPPSVWVSVITSVEPMKRFTDEQKRGPFGFWHHTHELAVLADGSVEVRDDLYYGMPFGIFGQIAHALFVRRMTEALFAYRKDRLNTLLGHRPPTYKGV